ncbi:MAG: DUF4292 domain-containing protein [Bacteroidia bacterium]|nr:DUF4292 domain-containing protein [Bacteroidia bacterium]
MNKIFIFFIGIVLIIASCRSTKNIQTAIIKKDTTAIAPVVIDHSHEDSIAFIKENYEQLGKNTIDFKAFSAKLDVSYVDGGDKNFNVTAHLRMYKDSVIWVTITGLLGIEGLRAYITRDSVKLLDKQNKIYTLRSLSYLQEVSDLPLDLSSLQDLLIGNPVFFDSDIVSYSKSDNTISLLNYGDFFKNLLTLSLNGLIQSTKLDDLDEMRNRTCYLTYDDYENKKGINFSTRRSISIAEKKKLDIKLNFKQYEFNETLSFPFSIPKNYKAN